MQRLQNYGMDPFSSSSPSTTKTDKNFGATKQSLGKKPLLFQVSFNSWHQEADTNSHLKLRQLNSFMRF